MNKILATAVGIKNGADELLSLRSLTSKVDWGYACDYIREAHMILKLDESEIFIVTSGTLPTV